MFNGCIQDSEFPGRADERLAEHMKPRRKIRRGAACRPSRGFQTCIVHHRSPWVFEEVGNVCVFVCDSPLRVIEIGLRHRAQGSMKSAQE